MEKECKKEEKEWNPFFTHTTHYQSINLIRQAKPSMQKNYFNGLLKYNKKVWFYQVPAQIIYTVIILQVY